MQFPPFKPSLQSPASGTCVAFQSRASDHASRNESLTLTAGLMVLLVPNVKPKICNLGTNEAVRYARKYGNTHRTNKKARSDASEQALILVDCDSAMPPIVNPGLGIRAVIKHLAITERATAVAAKQVVDNCRPSTIRIGGMSILE